MTMSNAERQEAMMPGPKFAEAVEFAREAHWGQKRKGTKIPYLSHPLAVSSLVMEYGGSETEAIAGLLHDVLEDCEEDFEESLPGSVGEEIEARFGSEVLRIVSECSDSIKVAGKVKPSWESRKRSYLAQLPQKTSGALLVTACDKLHNLTAIARDYRSEGDALWERFNGSKEDIQWYYERLAFELLAAGVTPARDLALKLAEFSWLPLEEKAIDPTIREPAEA